MALARKANSDLIEQIELQREAIQRKQDEYADLRDEIDKMEIEIEKKVKELQA